MKNVKGVIVYCECSLDFERNKMLSAIKKLTSRQDGTASTAPIGGNGSPSSGVAASNAACTPMVGSLQRKFAKGVQYNSMW